MSRRVPGLSPEQSEPIAWQKSAEGIVSPTHGGWASINAAERQGTIPIRVRTRGRADQGPNGKREAGKPVLLGK